MIDLDTKEKKNTWAENVIPSFYIRGIEPSSFDDDGTNFMNALRLGLNFDSIQDMFDYYIARYKLTNIGIE